MYEYFKKMKYIFTFIKVGDAKVTATPLQLAY